MNFHELLKQRVENEGCAVALKWGENLRKGRAEMKDKKRSINERIKDKVDKDGAQAVEKWNARFEANKRKGEQDNE